MKVELSRDEIIFLMAEGARQLHEGLAHKTISDQRLDELLMRMNELAQYLYAEKVVPMVQ